MNERTMHLETYMFDAYIPWNMNALVARHLKVTWTKASVVSITDLIRIGGDTDEARRGAGSKSSSHSSQPCAPSFGGIQSTVTRKNIAGVLILRSLRLPLVRKINTREFSILRRTVDPQKQVTRCFMIWRLNITHSRHPKRVYLAVSVITDLSDCVLF